MISLSVQKTLQITRELHEEGQLENIFYSCEEMGQWTCSDPSQSCGCTLVKGNLLENSSGHQATAMMSL